MSNDKFFVIKLETYPYDILYCIGVTPQEILNKIDRDFEPKLDKEEKDAILGIKRQTGKTLRLKNGAYLLWLKQKPRTAKTIALLSHEVRHVTEMMMESIGVKYSFDCDEAFAYLHETIEYKVLSCTM